MTSITNMKQLATSATDTWRRASGSVESIKYFEKCAASSEANTSPISPTSNCYTSQWVRRKICTLCTSVEMLQLRLEKIRQCWR